MSTTRKDTAMREAGLMMTRDDDASSSQAEADPGARSAGPIAPGCGGGMGPGTDCDSAEAGWAATYRGRVVTELTREELVEAYTAMCATSAEFHRWLRMNERCVARQTDETPATTLAEVRERQARG